MTSKVAPENTNNYNNYNLYICPLNIRPEYQSFSLLQLLHIHTLSPFAKNEQSTLISEH